MSKIPTNSLSERLSGLFSQGIEDLDRMKYGTVEIKVRDGKIVIVNINHTFNLEKGDLDQEK